MALSWAKSEMEIIDNSPPPGKFLNDVPGTEASYRSPRSIVLIKINNKLGLIINIDAMAIGSDGQKLTKN